MSRSYRGIRPKANRVHSVEDVMELYDTCRNTITNWVKGGLRPVDHRQPQLFRGSELKRFHDHMHTMRYRPLSLLEFKCLPCGTRVTPTPEKLFISRLHGRGLWAIAPCPSCERIVRKVISETLCDELEFYIESNTAPGLRDENKGALQAGIGKVEPLPLLSLGDNERIIYEYQLYGARNDEKTVDAHLASLRDFETFHTGRDFRSLKPADAARYRAHLIASVGTLSRSTVQHRAAHLAQFTRWLVEQDGYRKLNKTICDNFKLPKSAMAHAPRDIVRNWPTTDELRRMISCAPAAALIQRRDRAIVAASFLFGTRSNATASLRLGSVDMERRVVVQDATRMRIKNSKSQKTWWFPVDSEIGKMLTEWIEELLELGCTAEDALFPSDHYLANTKSIKRSPRAAIEPWDTDAGVRRAFRRICEAADIAYHSPHSAKHYLGSIRNDFCKTSEQRRAWSQNLGHENEITTETRYQKVSDDRQGEIFNGFWQDSPMPVEDLVLLVSLHEHELTPGTPDFYRARKLSDEWKSRYS
ncbi:tyrosine-type recombinase/integrase [Aquibium oceanicum]|nr:tyrosine-type recombinase/integrase [Aquibium oceanicum]